MFVNRKWAIRDNIREKMRGLDMDQYILSFYFKRLYFKFVFFFQTYYFEFVKSHINKKKKIIF